MIEGGIKLGPIEVLPGRGGKPVVRDAVSKKLMAGTYQLSKHITDVVMEGKSKRDFEKSETYRNALEVLTPMFGSDKQSLERLLDVLWKAIEGEPTAVRCHHPGCGELTHMYYPKSDSATAFKLFENLVGKAAQTQNVSIKEDKLVQILEQRTVNVVVQGLNETEAFERRDMIAAFGYDV